MFKFFKIILLLLCIQSFGQKTYLKNYYINGKIKSEGWILNNLKTDYWHFYNENGIIIEEGHYVKNLKTKWWIFYNSKNQIVKKCEFKNNKMDGYCLIYSNNKIIKGEKYILGKKVKEYHTIEEFKKDNKLSYN